MSASRYDQNDSAVHQPADYQDSKAPASASNKLERRRRIEDIHEERRLKQEFSEFY